MKRADEILAAGAKHLADRAATRDQPEGERSMGRCVAAFNAMYSKDLTVEQGWQFLTLLKMSRSAVGAFNLDDYEDGAAYFALAAEDAYRERVKPEYGPAAQMAMGGMPALDTLRAFAPAPGKEFVVMTRPEGAPAHPVDAAKAAIRNGAKTAIPWPSDLTAKWFTIDNDGTGNFWDIAPEWRGREGYWVAPGAHVWNAGHFHRALWPYGPASFTERALGQSELPAQD